MPRTLLLLRLVISAFVTFSFACSGSPTAPTNLSPALDPLARITLGMSCIQELDGYQCRAHANVSADIQRDVTGFATWSTSDTSIATVNSVGFVTVLRAGEVAIRASYQDANGFMIMQVEPGGLRRYFRALSGWVRDSRDEAKIAGVTVLIVDGPNAGRIVATGSDGAYQLYDLELGTFTVRFSKSGYVPAERIFSLTGDKFNGLDVLLNRSS